MFQSGLFPASRPSSCLSMHRMYGCSFCYETRPLLEGGFQEGARSRDSSAGAIDGEFPAGGGGIVQVEMAGQVIEAARVGRTGRTGCTGVAEAAMGEALGKVVGWGCLVVERGHDIAAGDEVLPDGGQLRLAAPCTRLASDIGKRNLVNEHIAPAARVVGIALYPIREGDLESGFLVAGMVGRLGGVG